MYIQAYIEKMSEYVVDILDGVVGNQDYPEYEEKLKQYNLDLVGISCLTHSIADTQMTANIVRKLNPNAIIVLGGPHCEMFPEYAMAMDNVDAIVVGDGEQAFLDIIQRVDQGEDFAKIPGLWWKDAKVRSLRTKNKKDKMISTGKSGTDRRRVEFELTTHRYKKPLSDNCHYVSRLPAQLSLLSHVQEAIQNP